jgi:hypothetical protein
VRGKQASAAIASKNNATPVNVSESKALTP